MNIFRRFVSRVRIFAALFALVGVTVPVSAIAQGNSDEEYSSHALASVWGLEVSSPGDNSLVGSFRVVNDSNSAISGVDYVVTLLSPRPEVQDGELISDTPIVYSREHVSANISLASKEEEVVPFTHTIPLLPENELPYRVRVTLITSNNRLLDRVDQNITLAGSESMFAVLDPVAVLVDSVELALEEGEEPIARSEWMPLEGVSVDPGTEVVLSSTLMNIGEEALSGTVVALFRRDLTTTTDFETRPLTAVTLSTGEQQTANTPFVVPSIPGVYEIFLAVEDEGGNRISTVGEFRVVVRGASASIVRVTADEIRLNRGEETVVTVSVVGPPDGSELSGTVEVALLDGETLAGSSEAGVELAPYVQSSVFRVLLNRVVEGDLTIRVTVRDGEGIVLDTYELEFSRELAIPSTLEKLVSGGQSVFLILTLGILILIAIGFIAFYTHRKLRGGSTILPLLLLLLLVTTMMGAVSFVKYSEATTYEAVGTQRVFPGMWWADRGLTHTVRTWYSIERDGQIQKVNPSSYVFTVGDRVIYEGMLISEMCTNYNQTYHNDWLIHLASGHIATKGTTNWSQQAAFARRSFTTRVNYTVFERGGEGGTDISGTFTINQQHVNSAGQSTLFTDVRWNRPSPINHWWYYYLFTHLTVQEEQPPAPVAIDLTRSPSEIWDAASESSTLTWTVENADTCEAFSFRRKHNDQVWESSPLNNPWVPDWQTSNVSAPPSGSKSVRFPVENEGVDYRLTLRCEGDGDPDSKSVEVTVYPAHDIRDAVCSVDPSTVDSVGDSVTYSAKALGGTGTYSYEWQNLGCSGESFYYCNVEDIYVERVPGYVYYNLYIAVKNLPLGINEYHMIGATTWGNRRFTVVSREPDGSAILMGEDTVGNPNYILGRKFDVGLTDLSRNPICVSKNEAPPEGGRCTENFEEEKQVRVTITSGTKSVTRTCPSVTMGPLTVTLKVDGKEREEEAFDTSIFNRNIDAKPILSWEVTPDSVTNGECYASGNWGGEKNFPNGSDEVSFVTTGLFTYTITCMRQGGEPTDSSVKINVTDNGGPGNGGPLPPRPTNGYEERP